MSTLWALLRTKGTADQVAKVEKLTAHAAALLDLVRDTFPTYTLHNHVHAENVITRMEDLLGDRAEDLSALESAILLLSAYFHDIGMVYSAEERESIPGEAPFDEYLRTHHEEYLRFQNSTEPDESVIEGYCRWRHAVRVYDFLSDVPEEWLTWNGVYLRKHLGMVCASHNDNADSLKDNHFATDFLGTCDLRFCAILLRLADILDFDNSRSPESVYQYLGIGRRSTPRTAASDVEWLKHLNANGFVFPPTRPREYPITLVAGPDHPAVESDVRSFLDTIEGELASCQSLLRQCAERWTGFTLPGRVDRGSIVSKGYVWGDFRFKLDRHAILDLFMGENLYSDPSVFLRELLQNSIDATRSRAKLQKLDPVTEGWGITLTDWHDQDGYQWIRIDDNGSGMNQHIVENYLLRIGKSYYSSAEFQAEMHRHAHGERPLVSIGKFGVGLLSCFMLADQVELTTLRVDAQGNPDKPLRMSFHHVADYSFLQTPDEKATPFPGKFAEDPGYRTTPGTSIAVRIDPRKHGRTLDIDKLCKEHLLAARVPVKANGKLIADGKATSDRAVWPQESIQLPVRWEAPRPISGWVADTSIDANSLQAALAGLTVELMPLDFSSTGPGRIVELDGMGFMLTIDSTTTKEVLKEAPLDVLLNLKGIKVGLIPDALIARFRASLGRLAFGRDTPGKQQFPHLEFRPYSNETNRLLSHRLSALLPSQYSISKRAIEQWDQFRSQLISDADRSGPTVVGRIDWRSVTEHGLTAPGIRAWSHNGIQLPVSGLIGGDRPWVQFGADQWGLEHEAGSFVGSVYGSFWLTDELRPELDIARRIVRAAPFRLYSSINLAVRRSLNQLQRTHLMDGRSVDGIRGYGSAWKLSEVLADPLMDQPDGWSSQLVLELGNRERASVLDIGRIVADAGECVVRWPGTSFLYQQEIDECLLRALMCINLDLVVDGTTGAVKVRSSSTPRLDPRIGRHPPGSFLPYTVSEILMCINKGKYGPRSRPPNLHHELIEWFLNISPVLQSRAPALESEFFTTLGKLGNQISESDPLTDLRKVIDRIGVVVSGSGATPFPGTLDKSCLRIVPEQYDW